VLEWEKNSSPTKTKA